MDKHCVSLELAKQLKETGWKKKTEVYWDITAQRITNKHNFDVTNYPLNFIPAPLATEILEELPIFIDGDKEFNLHIKKVVNNDYIVKYEDGGSMTYEGKSGEEDYYQCDESLPNALAKMYLYLKKEGLLNGQ